MCNITNEGALDAALWHLIDEQLGVPEADRRDDIAEYVTRAVVETEEQTVDKLTPYVQNYPGAPGHEVFR